MCATGPPADVIGDVIELRLSDGAGGDLRFLTIAWTSHLSVNDSDGQTWSELDIRVGKYHFNNKTGEFPPSHVTWNNGW